MRFRRRSAAPQGSLRSKARDAQASFSLSPRPRPRHPGFHPQGPRFKQEQTLGRAGGRKLAPPRTAGLRPPPIIPLDPATRPPVETLATRPPLGRGCRHCRGGEEGGGWNAISSPSSHLSRLRERCPVTGTRGGMPPGSAASRDASLFALDPSCARRLRRGRRDAGRPSRSSSTGLRRVEHRADGLEADAANIKDGWVADLCAGQS